MNKHEVTRGASSLLLGAARAMGQKCAREREMTTWRAMHMRINRNKSRYAHETRIALLGNANSFNPNRTKFMYHEVHCESICVA